MSDADIVRQLPTWRLIEIARDGIDSFAGDGSEERAAFDVLEARFKEAENERDRLKAEVMAEHTERNNANQLANRLKDQLAEAEQLKVEVVRLLRERDEAVANGLRLAEELERHKTAAGDLMNDAAKMAKERRDLERNLGDAYEDVARLAEELEAAKAKSVAFTPEEFRSVKHAIYSEGLREGCEEQLLENARLAEEINDKDRQIEEAAGLLIDREDEVERLQREKVELIQAKVDLRGAFDAQVNRASLAEAEVERLRAAAKQAEEILGRDSVAGSILRQALEGSTSEVCG